VVVVAVNKTKKQSEPPAKSRNSDPNGQPSENIMDSRVFEQRPQVNSTLEKRKLIATSKVAGGYSHRASQISEENKESAR